MEIRFKELAKEEQTKMKREITEAIELAIAYDDATRVLAYFDHEDPDIRRAACHAVGRLYRHTREDRPKREMLLLLLERLYGNLSDRVREVTICACAEIASRNFSVVEPLLVRGMHDRSRTVREAVTHSLRAVSRKNPSILRFCEEHIVSPEPEVRGLICLGLILRGKTHPQDVMGLLKKIQHDDHPQVRKALVHTLGQISLEPEGFAYVEEELSSWRNPELYEAFREEALGVQRRGQEAAQLDPEGTGTCLSLKENREKP